MAPHTGKIGDVQVPGFRYVVFGPKRGNVGTHRTKRAALRSLAEDAEVYRWRDGWELVGSEGDVELVETPG